MTTARSMADHPSMQRKSDAQLREALDNARRNLAKDLALLPQDLPDVVELVAVSRLLVEAYELALEERSW